MWVSGIMQGLMWREYDDATGYLVYSFAESVAALYPYFVLRTVGGLIYRLWRITHGLQLVQDHSRRRA